MTTPIVHIVEDDDSARVATARMLKAVGYAVEAHASATEFLSSPSRPWPGCVLLNVRVPDMNDMDLQAQLIDCPGALPIIFVTGHRSIPMSIRAIQSGAVDFLTKPVQKQALLDAIARALMRDTENRARGNRLQQARERYERLTPREREVFAHLIGGQLNKQVAYDLGTAERTIKAHRHNIMEKLGATSVIDLKNLATKLDIRPVRNA